MGTYRSSKSGFAVELALVTILACRDRVPEIAAEPVTEDREERILYVRPETMREANMALVPVELRGQVTAVAVFPLPGDAGTARSERVGFQSGDRIVAVDGIPPGASNDAFGEAFRRIGKASETRVRVRRRGRSIVLIYRSSAGAP